MNFGIFELLQLIGALGFFIFGMKIMSDGIQKVAGSKMRGILSKMTSNRFLGVATGFLITALSDHPFTGMVCFTWFWARSITEIASAYKSVT